MSFIFHAWQLLKRFLWIKYSHRYNFHENDNILYVYKIVPENLREKNYGNIWIPLSSTHRFHTRTTPFQHPKSLSSTPKTPQFNTKTASVQHRYIELFFLRGVWNWGVCGTEGLRGLKRSGPFVWNWCIELRGPQYMLGSVFYVSWKGKIWKIK